MGNLQPALAAPIFQKAAAGLVSIPELFDH
jgi:hypothetical protein